MSTPTEGTTIPASLTYEGRGKPEPVGDPWAGAGEPSVLKAALERWLKAKDVEKGWLHKWSACPRRRRVGVTNLRSCSQEFRELDELVGETRRALKHLEWVAREAREG